MPKVTYNKPVSDPKVREVLERIAAHFGRDVKVTSGDRKSVPAGGSKTSHHLANRAADFHVVGLSDNKVFKELQAHKDKIFGKESRFQVISHGPHTQTQGAHLHVGRYEKGKGTGFYTEGHTKDSKGKYERLGGKPAGGGGKPAGGGGKSGGRG